MGFLDKFFNPDDISTGNKEIISAHKILQDSSLSDDERAAVLPKLKSIYLSSSDKDDLKAISQSILRPLSNGGSVGLRESVVRILDAIVENCLFAYHNHPLQHAGSRLKLSVVSEYAMPVLMRIAEYRREQVKELRRMALGTLLKMAPFAISDECLIFLARRLSDETGDRKTAVISTFENLVKGGDDALKRRIVRFSLPALCEALNDLTVWVRAARAIEGLERFALGAAPFLYKKLDDKDGEWAAVALRKVTGMEYGKDEKEKWEKWLKEAVVE